MMADYQINSSLRESITRLAQHIEKALGPEASGFTLEWVSNSADIDNNTFDTQFEDRKSTRLNSSHGYISYAVFCLKKNKQHAESRRTSTRDSSRAHGHAGRGP